MATRKGGPGGWGVGKNPVVDKYKNITNAATVRNVIRSGGPITGSGSGVRSISGRDAINTMGQFLVGEGIGTIFGIAAKGAIKAMSPVVRKVVSSGARPMTTAQRSVAVTRAGRTGVGKIGPSIRHRAPDYIQEGGDYPGIASEPFSSYDEAYGRARSIFDARKFSNNVPAYLRRSGMSPAAAARANRIISQIEQDQIERRAIRNQAWAFFQGKGGKAGRGRIKDLDRVYEGSLTNRIAGPRIKPKNPRKKK
jgi:hypothetical protein